MILIKYILLLYRHTLFKDNFKDSKIPSSPGELNKLVRKEYKYFYVLESFFSLIIEKTLLNNALIQLPYS